MVGPIVSQSLSDVFCDNEYGPNFLFRNNGDGTFTDVAQQAGVKHISTCHGLLYQLKRAASLYNREYYHIPVGLEDPMQHGRGVALADFNRDGKTDIVYGNWNGPHRLYLQMNNRKQKFKVCPKLSFFSEVTVRKTIVIMSNDSPLRIHGMIKFLSHILAFFLLFPHQNQ